MVLGWIHQLGQTVFVDVEAAWCNETNPPCAHGLKSPENTNGDTLMRLIYQSKSAVSCAHLNIVSARCIYSILSICGRIYSNLLACIGQLTHPKYWIANYFIETRPKPSQTGQRWKFLQSVIKKHGTRFIKKEINACNIIEKIAARDIGHKDGIGVGGTKYLLYNDMPASPII